jgi:hypothetical protein
MPDSLSQTLQEGSQVTSANLIHSPSSGFIDIKPIDTFASYWKEAASIALFLLACGLVVYLLLPYLRGKRGRLSSMSLYTPMEAFTLTLEELKNNSLPVRHFSESLSSAIREYIDALMGLSTRMKTPRESLRQFEPMLKKRLPLFPEKNRREVEDMLFKILSLLEESAYSDHPWSFDTPAWRSEMLSIAEKWATHLQSEIDREAKRTQLITEQSKADATTTSSPSGGGIA